MLELAKVDLDGLAEALEDHSDFHQWLFDPSSGEVTIWSEDTDEPLSLEQGALVIDPIPSAEAYADLQDFVAEVPDRQSADLLARAIAGRGAFRRFKDTLVELPELRQAWFGFHAARMRRRALEWLSDLGVVDQASIEKVLAHLHEPEMGTAPVDPFELASQTARKLRARFGPRLLEVVLFGSHATGTATDDSDLDLAVVLSDVCSSWDDGRRMDDILWDQTRDSGVTVSALVVDADDWRAAETPLLRTAKARGRSVA